MNWIGRTAQESKPQHLRVHARRNAVKAMRQLFAAVDAGGFFVGVSAAIQSQRPIRRCTVPGLVHVRYRPATRCLSGAFAADAGTFDFPPPKLDTKGKVVLRPDGEPASVIDDYDDTDALSHMRAQAQDWADACRAAARLLREQIPLRQALAQASAEPPDRTQPPASLPDKPTAKDEGQAPPPDTQTRTETTVQPVSPAMAPSLALIHNRLVTLWPALTTKQRQALNTFLGLTWRAPAIAPSLAVIYARIDTLWPALTTEQRQALNIFLSEVSAKTIRECVRIAFDGVADGFLAGLAKVPAEPPDRTEPPASLPDKPTAKDEGQARRGMEGTGRTGRTSRLTNRPRRI